MANDALEKLDQQIARLRELGAIVPQSVQPIADELERVQGQTIAAGTDAYGVAWKETAKGERPLRNAAQALGVGVVGSRVIFRLRGPEARHHKGHARGGIVRAVLPTYGLPPSWIDSIRGVLRRKFDEAMS